MKDGYHLFFLLSFLNMCEDYVKRIFESIVTGDETVVLYYDPLFKVESMGWQRYDKPRKSMFSHEKFKLKT